MRTAAVDCRVLVVDDDPTIRAVVRDALALEGYTVLVAAHVGEALDQVERARPHVVLLDMRMPVVDGWEFARRLRERDLHPYVVTMTAESARRRAAEIGADDYLAKPFDLDLMLAMVEGLCARTRARDPGGSPLPA